MILFKKLYLIGLSILKIFIAFFELMGLSVQKGLIFQFLKKKWLRKKWFETKIWHLKGKKLFHVSPYLLVMSKTIYMRKVNLLWLFIGKFVFERGKNCLAAQKLSYFGKKKIFSKTTYMSWLKIGSIGPLNVWKKWSNFGVIYSSSFGQNFFFRKKRRKICDFDSKEKKISQWFP